MNKNLKFFSQGTGIIEHYIFIRLLALILDLFKNVNPNFITFLSFLLALLSSYLIISGNIFLGLILYFFFPFLDLLDGAIARKFNKKSIIGAIFDGFVDTISEIIILISLGIYFNEKILFLGLVIFILITQLLTLRIKWIKQNKERQLDFRQEKNTFKLLIIILTRNDIRKLFLLIFGFLNYYNYIFLYFLFLYILSFLFSLIQLGKK